MVIYKVNIKIKLEEILSKQARYLLSKQRCHDCGAYDGEFHAFGCDMEVCPFCGKQLITCDCIYQKININLEKGITNEQIEEWGKTLDKKGLIPYTPFIYVCSRCGKRNPEFFHVLDWKKYVPPEMQDKILCLMCYKDYKNMFLKGWKYGKFK